MRRILIAVVALVLIGGAFVAYPLYPSPRSLCGIMEERSATVDDRWASPHRGAVVLLSGELYGLSLAGGHQYALRTRCKGYDYFVAIDASPYSMQSAATRATLRQLTAQRHAPFTLIARVTSEVQGCFSPPMVLTAMAMQSRGEARVDRRKP